MSMPAKNKITGPIEKTIRLELDLFEPSRDSYPEFNFLELARIQEEKEKEIIKKKELQKANGLPPDPIDEDDLLRIAKHFEKKYNSTTYGSVRLSRGVRRDEYADIAAGYDESDSFIDNTDAYDEMIPRNLETKMGGFYINCGPLEYEKLPNCEGDTPSIRTHKRQLSSSTSATSSDESTAQKEKKNLNKKVCLSSNNSSESSKNGKSNNGSVKPSVVKEKVNSNPVSNNGQKTEERSKANTVKDTERSKKISKGDNEKKGSGNESSSIKPGQISCKKLSELSSNVNSIVKTSSNIMTHTNKDIGAYSNFESTAKKQTNVKPAENGDENQRKAFVVQELLRQKQKFLDLSVELVNPEGKPTSDLTRVDSVINHNNHIL